MKFTFDRLFFTVLAVPLDFAAVVLAGLFAWTIRFSETVQAIRPAIFATSLPFGEYVQMLLIAAAVTVAVLAVLGMYRFPRPEPGRVGSALRIFVATSTTLAAIALIFFFKQELFESRFLVIAGWALATVLLITERAFVGVVERWLARRFGIGLRKAMVIGNDAITERVVKMLSQDASFGLRVVKRLHEPSIEEVARAVGNPGVEVIVLADPDYPKERVVPLVDFVHEQHLSFRFVPNLFQTLTSNTAVGVVGGVPVVELRRTALDGWGRVFKRAMDIVGSLAGIVFFAPAMAVIAFLIKLEDPSGPVIYRNQRAGERGRPFFTLKFRSMYWKYSTGPDAPDPEGAMEFERKLAKERSRRKGPVWKILDDPRRTQVGRFIERTSLDELPQFFNVLKGDMSLVGPRPHMLEQVAAYSRKHKHVLAIKPGITGMAQISGRSDLDFEDEVHLDTHYIEHWSPWLDMKIMFRTPFAVFFQRHQS